MWRYTISGMPATKFRTMGKSSKIWDEYAAARMHAEIELNEQLGERPRHQGLLSVGYTFYLPHTKSSVHQAVSVKDLYATTKPHLLLMTNFVESIIHEFLLDSAAMIVSTTTKKYFDALPRTYITIKPLTHKK